ncbi:hypothetical protein LTR95_004876 [Oleoguttula sp. CCFEE 5521]
MTDRDEARSRNPKFSTFSSRKPPRDEPEPYDSRNRRRSGDHHRNDQPRRRHSRARQTHCNPTSRSTHYRDERSRQDRPNPRLVDHRVTRSRSRSPASLPSGRESHLRREPREAAINRYVPPKPRHRSPSPRRLEPADFFVIDTKGDLDNVKYGGISKWKVPKYHLGGGGAVLGLDPRFEMDWAASTKEGYVLKRMSKSVTRSLPVSNHEVAMDAVTPIEPTQKEFGVDDDQGAELWKDDEVEQAFEGMGQEPTKPGLPIVTPKG